MATQEVEKKSQDTVKVKVTGKTHVKPGKIIGKRECQLITFDLPYLAFYYNQKLFLYKDNEEFDAMVDKLKDGLKVVLEEFHQLVGKLGKDEEGYQSNPLRLQMDPVLSITVLSVVLGALIALFFFKSYFGKRRSEVQSIAKAELQPDHKKPSKPSQPISKKSHSKPHTHASDKDQNKRHHPLDVNTLKGHGDSVTGLCFSFDGRNLATACADGVVRVFKLDDALSKSFKFLRINLPPGGPPTAVTFTDDASSIVVATHNLSGSSLYMYGEEKTTSVNENKQQAKLPLPEIKWEHHKIHDKRAILTLYRATASYGSGDGSTIIASCSEGTDIIIWHGKTGKILGHVDSNQLKNHMAAISPNGRFLAAAAFTADVKVSTAAVAINAYDHIHLMGYFLIIYEYPYEVWEIVYSKDGSVKEVSKAMQLKGHKSAVTWLCFAPNSEQIITASKDDSIRIWNINGLYNIIFIYINFVYPDLWLLFSEVRYHLDEDPKTLKVFPIPLRDSSGAALHYDRLSLSPDGRILAATHRSTLQWLSVETGKVLDMADKAHEGVGYSLFCNHQSYLAGDITSIAWAPKTIPMGNGQGMILATSSGDKKVKLWTAPSLD
ncbi:hypothetical protein Patl1_00267 [Pistacia atlantica]|uniref:Uncharacterized protein n=1 Tax=Pistacia atlantica TaxID=434234 RepID=A0ACC1C9Q4_9ROSI|nr:hypothetical protein Patl1_00267 [Pistacia atlantica]